ncbi:LacI family DNA-binding transcriptional regulator [Tessaracoccus sp.]|uniref:LacI family DNA-binding transcriptional regulator n=1 Tax=Tessaracoccus sp. TaxID=1971211 RepID=UPI00262E3E06|nr:LacI family DNA-binding transcriptional regulator [Tessaracoccus sp.]
MAVTLAHVAALAGVSPQTVSNSISNPDIVKDTTLTRVRAAIDELGYTHNVRARMLRQQRTGNIGLRMRPTSDNVAGVLIDRLLHELSARQLPMTSTCCSSPPRPTTRRSAPSSVSPPRASSTSSC